MKLRTKIFAYILLPTLLFFAGTVYYVSVKVQEISEKNAMELLYANGQSLSQQIQQELENILTAVQTISQSYEAMIARGETPSREQAQASLKELLENHPNTISSWMFWEVNAFDGRDAEYKNTYGHDATGRFIPLWTRTESGEPVLTPVKGYNEPGQIKNLVDQVFQTGKVLLYEPYTDSTVSADKLMTSLAIPIKINEKVVGMAGVDLLLEDLDEIVSQYTFYETGFAGLLSNDGLVISHQNDELIGKNYFETGSVATEEGRDRVIESIKQGKTDVMNGYSDTLQTDIYRIFTPVYIGDIETPWSAFLAAPVDEVMKDANSLANTILLVTIIAIILLTFAIVFVTYRVVNVIKIAAVHAADIANGDFSKIPDEKFLHRKDELGELARAFKAISESMSVLIGKVQDSTKEVHRVAVAIDDAAKQSSDAANDVANAIAEVSSVAENQKQGAEENAKSIEEMSQGIQRNAQAISTLSEASNEMGEQANLGKEVVQLAIEQMNLIQNETLETKEAINELQQQAYEIEGIVAMITDISEQTNLLALNAAIEAARAGEAGKGFAVVADEVRKLADQTNLSAQDIQKLIASIQEHSNKANQSMNENEKEVTVGIERIREVEKVFTKIIDSISHVVKEIDELAAVMEQMAAISEEVTASSQEIAGSAENTSSHAQQVAASAEEQLATMEELASTTSKLKNLADDLNDLIKQFKIRESVNLE